MPLVQQPDAEIHYEAGGRGPAVVFAHGAGGNRLSWWQRVPRFEATQREENGIFYQGLAFRGVMERPIGGSPGSFANWIRVYSGST
jgi:pimeloyl-ACP methyl ester carboxylesterase